MDFLSVLTNGRLLKSAVADLTSSEIQDIIQKLQKIHDEKKIDEELSEKVRKERQEALKQKVTKSNVSALKMLAETKGSDLAKILSFYEVERVEDMTMEQWQNAMNLLNRKK